jgi:DNA/RNA endonuclease G (NUC1)
VDKYAYAKYPSLTRLNVFGSYTCPELAGQQVTAADFKMTPAQIIQFNHGKQQAWDKGHLSPYALFMWSYKAAKTSNFYVNIAPQDPYTNQVVWNYLEAQIKCFLSDKTGLVITGVSPTALETTKTGFEVPAFFWKLVCFNEGSSTYVVGFIGDNSIINRGSSAEKDQRKASVLQMSSQRQILQRLNNVGTGSRSYAKAYETMWTDAQGGVLQGKLPVGSGSLLNIASCVAAQDLAPNIVVS